MGLTGILQSLQSGLAADNDALEMRHMQDVFSANPDFAAGLYNAQFAMQQQQQALRAAEQKRRQQDALRAIAPRFRSGMSTQDALSEYAAITGDIIPLIEATKQKPFDLKEMAQQAVLKSAYGMPLDNDDIAVLKAMDTLEGQKTTFEPNALGYLQAQTTPNPYGQMLSRLGGGGLDNLYTQGINPSAQTYTSGQDLSTLPALEDNIPQMAGQDMFMFDGYGGVDPMAASQAAINNRKQAIASGLPTPDMGLPPEGSALPWTTLDIDQTANDMMAMEDAGIDRNSPLYQQKVTEEAAKSALLQSNEAAKAAIGVAAKGDEVAATEAAKYEASKPKKLDAINRIKGNMMEAEKALSDLPRGLIQAGAGYLASGVAGFPTKMATAEAKVNTLLPAILQDMKQLVREPGEGTFTEGDAKSIQGMVFDPNAPLEAKLASYQALMGVMQRYEQSLGQKRVAPVDVNDLIRKYSQ